VEDISPNFKEFEVRIILVAKMMFFVHPNIIQNAVKFYNGFIIDA